MPGDGEAPAAAQAVTSRSVRIETAAGTIRCIEADYTMAVPHSALVRRDG
jgi:hypothetical protein